MVMKRLKILFGLNFNKLKTKEIVGNYHHFSKFCFRAPKRLEIKLEVQKRTDSTCYGVAR